MQVYIRDNVIFVEHPSHGAKDEAQQLCQEIHIQVKKMLERRIKPAIFHDASNLKSITEEYARTFGSCFADIKKFNPVQVAKIDKALMRVAAHFATTVGGVDMKICKNYDDCYAYLQQHGYPITHA